MYASAQPSFAGPSGVSSLLELLEFVPPSVEEIALAADAAEEPRFLLRLNRPLSADERRVVALEVPNAILHDDDDPMLTLAVAPDQILERPQAIQTIVRGISSVALTLCRAEADLLAECASAAEAVNRLLRLSQA